MGDPSQLGTFPSVDIDAALAWDGWLFLICISTTEVIF